MSADLQPEQPEQLQPDDVQPEQPDELQPEQLQESGPAGRFAVYDRVLLRFRTGAVSYAEAAEIRGQLARGAGRGRFKVEPV